MAATNWLDELKALSEAPSVATACGPAVTVLRGLLPGFEFLEVPDGFSLARPAGTSLSDLRLLYITHVDEIGGWVLPPTPDGRFTARLIGNRPEAFAGTPLQAFRYDAIDASATVPCVGTVAVPSGTTGSQGTATRFAGTRPSLAPLGRVPGHPSERPAGPASGRAGAEVAGEELLLQGEGLEPLTMLWTFREDLRVEGDEITGKALDPRVTVYCAVAAARRLQRRAGTGACPYGLLFCYAEECSRGPAEKAAEFCRRSLPALEFAVNADVPGLQNIVGVAPDEVAIRPLEGRNPIDPSFSIALYEQLRADGVEVVLGAAASGSQTSTFVPLARTVSIALPSIGVHQARVTMSVRGMHRCIELLTAIGERV